MSDRRSAFLTASWVNVVSSLLKIVVEGALGIVFGSVALTADAVHSVADLLASGVVLVWGRASFAGADEDHPHGHERFEPLTALFVGAVLILLGVLLFRDAATTLLAGPEARYSVILLAGLVFALVDRGACYWYTVRVNREVNSTGLAALAADSRNDVWTTGAAMIGVLGMAAGVPILDPLAGGVVSLLVVHQGVEVARENLTYLLDAAPDEATRDRLRGVVRDHEGVYGVHDFTAFYRGDTIEVEFHAEVDGDMSLAAAHDLETDLRERVLAETDVSDVHVHLDPAGLDEWEEADEAVVAT
ncbi:cation diffusion facilitator family transporter [Halobaculum sp. MBLA0147]|uniref:cation diffusion facilitator family transporter n=1 Tax=Halobaculum sp. MBLA0147 TaxID=3079934 RepID=UPI003523EE5F